MVVRAFCKNLVALILLTSPALASNGVCQYTEDWEHFYAPETYVIDEFNDPTERTLSELLRFTTKRFFDCDNGCIDLAYDNAVTFAEENIWQKYTSTQGDLITWSCGAEVDCKNPLAPNVRCTIEKMDCDRAMSPDSPYDISFLVATYTLECLGTLSCWHEQRPGKDCCAIVKVVKYDKT